VLNHAPEQPGFIEKLWSSSIGKLCFKNGWFDFDSRSLKKYGDEGTPHTLFKINRDFNEHPTTEATERLREMIFDPIFFDKPREELFMQFLSRSLAGMYQDKQWMVGLGERNSGKGALMTLTEGSFGQYVKATNSENLLVKQNGSSDVAKSLSWLLDYEFKRLAFSNEIEMCGTAINGALVKKLTSGGDIMEARKNYVDEMQFKSQAHLLILANDMPECKPSDCKQTCLHMPFPTTFVEPDDVRVGKPHIKVANHHIKDICKQPDVLDAFTYAVCCDHWTEGVVTMPPALQESHSEFVKQDDTKTNLLDLFHFTGQEESLSVQKVDEIIRHAGIHSVSKQKYGKWLEERNAFKKKGQGGRYAWYGLMEAKKLEWHNAPTVTIPTPAAVGAGSSPGPAAKRAKPNEAMDRLNRSCH